MQNTFFLAPARPLAAAVLALLCITAAALPAAAQSVYPSRPVTLVVPFPAGGATDVMARLLGGEVGKALGESVVIDNRVGAAGAIGAQYVARSAPDGYTLCFCGSGPVLVMKLIDPKLPYDPAKDFKLVTLTHFIDLMMVVEPTTPYKTLKDVVNAARARPGGLSYGSSGTGGLAHLGMEYFNRTAGINVNHIPYKGESQEIVDLLGGRLDIGILSLQAAAPLIKTGKVQPIAVWSKARAPGFPDVPSASESYPGFDAGTSVGITVAAGTPNAIVDKLQQAFVKAVKVPEVQAKMVEMGFTPMGTTSAEYASYLDRERVKWSKVIAEVDLTK